MSEGYSRVLVLIGLLVGFGVVWLPALNGHGRIFMHSCPGFLALLALGFPLAGVVMFWLVRLAPVLVPPPTDRSTIRTSRWTRVGWT